MPPENIFSPDKHKVDLFDKTGIYVGRFETDISVIPMVFKNSKFYTVTIFDDFKFVKRYGYSIVNY
ncbi:MAG: hypothetical protein JXB26_00805 [Candidatus Aminicenantes bacterium]|nr:hypothetical protein [Candidatus Aminicenantes bacterium]